MTLEDPVVVLSVVSAVEAELLRGTLEAEGVPVAVRERNELGAVIRLYTVMPSTMYDLLVSPGDAADARALIAAYEKGRGEMTDEELSAAADALYDERV